jgi:hypothetical protein
MSRSIRIPIAAAIFFSLSLILGSCEKDAQIYLPKGETKMVVNAGITADSLLKIFIGKTTPLFNNTSTKYIDNATPFLYVDGEIVTLNNIGKGYYVATEKAQMGSFYDVELFEEGFPTVSASTYVPNYPTLGNISARKATYEGDAVIQVTAEIIDTADTEDYYILEVREKGSYSSYSNIGITTKDFDCENSLDGVYEAQLLFQDRNFNGNTKSIIFSFLDNGYISGANNATLEVVLKRCTEEFWEYKRTYYLYMQTVDIPVVQPVQVFTNVTNGVGIFGGYTSVTKSISIK